ncbi:OmpA family protein [Sphingomonas sp. ac-8]|uniref:OmpA family protein n=1 Tax=Sphingomonas sp. ac-8 TaxID=3242977 RepID=UPI003A80DD8D
MMKRMMVAGSAIALGLAACSPPAEDAPPENAAAPVESVDNEATAETEDAANSAAHAKSILRPEIAEPEPEPPALEPIEAVVGFGESGLALDDAGRQALDALVADPTMQAGGAITLRGHTDSRGNDRANLVAARKRAEAVRDYLVEKGVAAERITVIAMGETNPLVPNARPDGSDDPEARAKNRRVELQVALPPAAPAQDETVEGNTAAPAKAEAEEGGS